MTTQDAPLERKHRPMASHISSNRAKIVRSIAPRNLMQPATALWRVYEIEAVHDNVTFEGRVLDFGCGDGSLSAVVFGESVSRIDLIGLEIDPTDADAARRCGLYQSVHTAPGDAIPEASASFVMVFSNSVLEHIPAIEPVLAEVSRVLKPGGRFVFTVPSEQFHACLLGDAIPTRLFRKGGESHREVIDRRLQHFRYWSESEWRSSLDGNGIDVTRAVRYFPVRAVQAWERMSAWTGGIAFELFGRKTQTRVAQRRLRLDRVDEIVPDGTRAKLLETLLGSSLSEPQRVTDELSGGLLIIATKR